MGVKILLAQAGGIPRWIGRRRMLHGVNGAEVMDLEYEEVSARSAANGQPPQQAQVGVGADADVIEVRVVVRLGQARVAGGRLDPPLQRARDIVSGDIPELDLLRLIEP